MDPHIQSVIFIHNGILPFLIVAFQLLQVPFFKAIALIITRSGCLRFYWTGSYKALPLDDMYHRTTARGLHIEAPYGSWKFNYTFIFHSSLSSLSPRGPVANTRWEMEFSCYIRPHVTLHVSPHDVGKVSPFESFPSPSKSPSLIPVSLTKATYQDIIVMYFWEPSYHHQVDTNALRFIPLPLLLSPL